MIGQAEFTGATFGQYEIQELIEDNTIIQTYHATQRSLKRAVALQVLNPEHRQDPIWVSALRFGAEAAASYQHPHITPIMDQGQQDGVDYVITRLMLGRTLRTRIEQQGALPFQTTVTIIRQIADALDFVHSAGGYHGDPAPVNIIFDEWGSAYIADFYLLGYLRATTLQQSAGVRRLLSSERMMGQAPTAQSDQFALAGVAYMMLTAKYPWEREAALRLPENLTPAQEHRADVPQAANAVLARAFAVEPTHRYPTIGEFARQFEIAMSDTPTQVFISYSRPDTAYVEKLRPHLQENGLAVWSDHLIEHGEQWFNQINDAIKTCAAFVVVMSPDAEASEWVQKEVLLAKRYQKPIFPMLLRGDEFPLLIDIQFANVKDETLPGQDFCRRLKRAVYGM
jgi:eukaryotic-like serine/threonine-protein kinase